MEKIGYQSSMVYGIGAQKMPQSGTWLLYSNKKYPLMQRRALAGGEVNGGK